MGNQYHNAYVNLFLRVVASCLEQHLRSLEVKPQHLKIPKSDQRPAVHSVGLNWCYQHFVHWRQSFACHYLHCQAWWINQFISAKAPSYCPLDRVIEPSSNYVIITTTGGMGSHDLFFSWSTVERRSVQKDQQIGFDMGELWAKKTL